MAGSVEIKAQVKSGEVLLEQAKKKLGIWGGMSHSIKQDDEGDSSISFSLHSVHVIPWSRGKAAERVFEWLDSLKVEYSVTFYYWKE